MNTAKWYPGSDTSCYEVNDAFITNVKAFLELLVRLAYSVLASLSRLAA